MRRLLLLVVVALICTIMCGPAFATGMTEAEKRAVEILGSGKVLCYRDVCRVQKVELPKTEPTMPFSEDVLRECAEANAKGANWRLAYVVGRSLRQEQEIMGWGVKKRARFAPDYVWWQDETHDYMWVNDKLYESAAVRTVKPGYRLFDFTKRFSSLPFLSAYGSKDQVLEIAKLGPNFERAEEQAVTEICFSNFLLSPNHELLMQNWFHWGKNRTDTYSCIFVGDFDGQNFAVGSHWPSDSDDLLGVVLARKP